jgi:hypothetical protein
MNEFGAANSRLSIIGYSLPAHDDYARQVLYRIVTNYQRVQIDEVRPWAATKEPLMIVDFQSNQNIAEFRRRYAFVDWDKTNLFLDGFNQEVVGKL